MVFYERGIIAKNEGFIEIKDKDILEHLQYEFNKNYTRFMTKTPLICGSLVK